MLHRFLQKRFSLMLALRYMNPLRAYFSVITLICMLGVSLGVMVMIVVLSVMEGLQRDIKGRFLAYTPHITISYSPVPGIVTATEDWREVVDMVKAIPGVDTAYPQIEDYVLVDAGGAQKPSSFRAVDTENEEQMKEMKALVAGGELEMGMGEEVVVSSGMAESMGVGIGDTIRVYAKRNYENVIDAYKRSEHALKKQEGQTLDILGQLWDKTVVKDNQEWVAKNKVDAVLSKLENWEALEYIRHSELELIYQVEELLGSSTDSEGNSLAYPQGTGEKYREILEKIKSLDTEKEDLEAFREIKEIVLPRDLEVVGIYLSSRHIISPEMFVPLSIGQELMGFEDAAQGVAVRTSDPYDLNPVEDAVRRNLGDAMNSGVLDTGDPEGKWLVRNWTDIPAMASWVSLMKQERVMLSFVLFFITLVSAFCIMAVMFAMALQRKKEIAVMRALGATPRQVVYVFLWQGIIIGLLGSALGIGLGLLVLHNRVAIQQFLTSLRLDPFPPNFHGVVQIPYHLEWSDVAMISIASFVMVVLAAIIPAVFSSRQDPAKSLRSL